MILARMHWHFMPGGADQYDCSPPFSNTLLVFSFPSTSCVFLQCFNVPTNSYSIGIGVSGFPSFLLSLCGMVMHGRCFSGTHLIIFLFSAACFSFLLGLFSCHSALFILPLTGEMQRDPWLRFYYVCSSWIKTRMEQCVCHLLRAY